MLDVCQVKSWLLAEFKLRSTSAPSDLHSRQFAFHLCVDLFQLTTRYQGRLLFKTVDAFARGGGLALPSGATGGPISGGTQSAAPPESDASNGPQISRAERQTGLNPNPASLRYTFRAPLISVNQIGGRKPSGSFRFGMTVFMFG